jgi:hypothetical protein
VHVVVEDEARLDASRRETGDDEEPQSAPGEAAMALLLLDEGCGPHEVVALGALAQRVLVAAWAEDLDAVLVPRFHLLPVSLAVRAVPHEPGQGTTGPTDPGRAEVVPDEPGL